MTSLCDTCHDPGACCRNIRLTSGVFRDGPPEQVDQALATIVTATCLATGFPVPVGHGRLQESCTRKDADYHHVRLGLPFKRKKKDADGIWVFSCKNLGRNGRCRDYENRPALCRSFIPGVEKPCVHCVAGIGTCAERRVPERAPVTWYLRKVHEAMRAGGARMALSHFGHGPLPEETTN